MDQQSSRRLLRSTFAVSIPTLLSRILGYLRDMIQAFFLGTGASADAFTIAYIIPNLLRRLTAEGAMTSAFIPVFTNLKKEENREKLWRFANIFFFDLTLVMAVLVVLGIVFSPLLVKVIAFGFQDVQGKIKLTILLTRIMFPYILLVSLAALAMAILNSFHKFFVPALTPVLFNISVITAAALFAARSREPALVFAVGVVVGGAVQLGFQIPFLWKKGMRFKPLLSFRHPAVRKVVKLMIPGIFGAGIHQINFALSRMIASTLEGGSVSSLYYSSRVQEFTLGLFSIALSIALLPTFSDLAASKDYAGVKKTLSFSLRAIYFITIPAMVGLFVLSRPIIHILYQRGRFDAESTAMTASCLLFFSLSLPFISGVKIIAPAFYSLKDTKTPAVVAFFVMIIYISLSVVLMGPLKVGGIALALSIASVFNFIALFVLLEKKIGQVEKKKILASALKSGLAALVMGFSVWWFFRSFSFYDMNFLNKLIVFAGTIFLGIAVYLILSLFLNKGELKAFRLMLSKKKIKKIKDSK
ncbi:MAG: murein biosynthesis integral membrane protein MurJ [Candidatus Aminicenantes bacterium]|nr:murein biosynthesis integral membrane protein MurJ [Candidatus Aminicenantes bacterium]